MNSVGKFLILLGIVVLIVVGLVIAKRPAQVSAPTENSQAGAVTAPAATGSVDDAVTAMKLEESEEASIAGSSDNDKAVVTSDSQSINSFSQAYDETTF